MFRSTAVMIGAATLLGPVSARLAAQRNDPGPVLQQYFAYRKLAFGNAPSVVLCDSVMTGMITRGTRDSLVKLTLVHDLTVLSSPRCEVPRPARQHGSWRPIVELQRMTWTEDTAQIVSAVFDSPMYQHVETAVLIWDLMSRSWRFTSLMISQFLENYRPSVHGRG